MIALALALAGVLAAAPPAAAAKKKAPKKYALLVGISDYGASPGVAELEQWSPLPGAKNDVTVLEAELKAHGFEVATLVDAAATGDAIRASFRSALIEKVAAGDIAVFHFSGHGQQIPDDNGPPEESDGYDESIVPFDNRGTVDYFGHLRDDEIGALLAELTAKTPNVTIFLDSCNSGTGTRNKGWERGAGPTLPAAPKRGDLADSASGFSAAGTKSRMVFLSAAHSTELAKEVVDPSTKMRMGAFTYLLTKVLRNARLEQRAPTGREVADEIAVRLPGLVKKQNATVEGDVDRHLFGTGTVPSASYLRVRPPDASGALVVEGGVLAGLVPRTTVLLFPADATVFDPAKALAEAKVESADATTAKLGKPSKALDALATAHGLRAQISQLSAIPDPLRLRVDGVGDAAAAAARASRAVIVVDGDAFDLRLATDSAGGIVLRDASGEAIGFPKGAGVPMEASLSATDPALAKRIGDALAVHVKRTRLLALENALPTTAVGVDLLLRAVRVDPPPAAGGDPLIVPGSVLAPGAPLKAGQGFQLGVKNRSKTAVYVSVVVLGPDGSIDLLFPTPNAGLDNRVRAGEERWFPSPFGLTPPAGTQIFKLFATSEPASFASLGASTREGAEEAGAFDTLLGGSIGVTTVRVDPPATVKWGADAMRVELVE